MKIISGIIGLLFLIVLVSACAGDPTATPTSVSSPTPTATTDPTFTPTPTPTIKQELRANLQGEPSSLDPQRVAFGSDFSVVRQVFRGLLGFKADLSLEPVVAAEVPTAENGGISEDGLVYTFKLRDDVTWSDGERLTASDFVYSIKRSLDPQAAARYASLYFFISGGFEYATAAGADAEASQSLRDAVAVEAPDEFTLRITLSRPNSTFLQKMAFVPAYPVRQDIVEKHGDKWTEAGNYIGNGPYIMTEWEHQDHITLEANPNYWGPKPELTKIVYRMIPDVNAELAAYQNNELEISRVPPGTEKAVLDDPVLGKEVLRLTKLSTIGMVFNTVAAPFDNVKVRQALTTAIDREAWIDKVKNGVGKPATSWLPPEMPGYDPDLGKEYTFDAQRAKELLGDAGFPGGEGFPSVTLTFVNLQDQPVIAQFIQAQMQQNLGIEVKLEPLDPPSFFQQVVGGRQFQMTTVAWSADYPDPEDFLASPFMTGSGNNIAGYSNPEFYALAGQASSELDQSKQIDLWMRAHEILVKDAPAAFFFYEENFILKKPNVQGFTLTAIDGSVPGDIRLADVSLSR